MLLISHIVIAILNLAFSSYVYVSPSKNKINIIYALTSFTILSGTVLTIMKPSHLMQSCVMGLIYLGVVVFAIVKARRKLVSVKNS